MQFFWKDFPIIWEFGAVNIKNGDKTIKKLMQIMNKFEKKGIFIQAVQSWPIISNNQIKLAFILSVESFLLRKNIAKKLSMEILLKLFAKKQIKDISWEKIGLENIKTDSEILIFACSREDRKKELKKALDEFKREINFKPRKKREIKLQKIAEFYGVEKLVKILEKRFSKREALENAIIERIAISAK